MAKKNKLKELPVTEESNVTSIALSPGKILEQARVQSGLSRDDVSKKLFLHRTFIAHLENDDYVELPGPTFVKGYISSYCKLLKINPEPLINIYRNTLLLDEVPEDNCAPQSLRKEQAPEEGNAFNDFFRNASNKMPNVLPKGYWVHAMSAVVVGALMYSFLFFWPNHQGDKSNLSPTHKMMSQQISEKEKTGQVGNGLNEGGIEQASQQQLNNKSKQEAPFEAIPNRLASQSENATSNSWGGFGELPFQVVALQDIDDMSAFSIRFMPGQPDKEVSDGHRIYVLFKEKARVSIQDSSGQVSHNQEHQRGSELSLMGQAPFQLAVSNASSVEVHIDSKPIDLSSPQR